MTHLLRLGLDFQKKRPLRWLFAVAFGALFGIAAGYNLKGSVSIVDGMSMDPTYAPGSYVFTAPIKTPLERGDIVLLDDHSDDYALKRIIGLPGETVDLWRGYVFINRKLLVEPYLPKFTLTFPDQRVLITRFHLGPGQYLVMGDNRLYSVDSRTYGPVQRKDIKSRVPEPENRVRSNFAPYTLPEPGKSLIRPI